MERVRARRQPPHRLPVSHDVDAHCALLRRSLPAVLEHRDGALYLRLAEAASAAAAAVDRRHGDPQRANDGGIHREQRRLRRRSLEVAAARDPAPGHQERGRGDGAPDVAGEDVDRHGHRDGRRPQQEKLHVAVGPRRGWVWPDLQDDLPRAVPAANCFAVVHGGRRGAASLSVLHFQRWLMVVGQLFDQACLCRAYI